MQNVGNVSWTGRRMQCARISLWETPKNALNMVCAIVECFIRKVETFYFDYTYESQIGKKKREWKAKFSGRKVDVAIEYIRKLKNAHKDLKECGYCIDYSMNDSQITLIIK